MYCTFVFSLGEQGTGLPHKAGRCDKRTTVSSPTSETPQLPQDSQLRYSSSASKSDSPLSDPFRDLIHNSVEPPLKRLQPVGQDEEDIPPPKPTVSTDTGIGTGSQGQKVKTLIPPFQVIVSNSENDFPVLDSESLATENTGQEVFVSSGSRVAESLLKENFCMNHLSLCAPSNTGELM